VGCKCGRQGVRGCGGTVHGSDTDSLIENLLRWALQDYSVPQRTVFGVCAIAPILCDRVKATRLLSVGPRLGTTALTGREGFG